jgi:hemerythrin-like metal-binding protein
LRFLLFSGRIALDVIFLNKQEKCMSFFTLTSDLLVGNTFIDSDHRRLVDLINDFHDAVSMGKGREIIGETLTNLEEYIIGHFDREEAEMKKIGYQKPDSHNHYLEHIKLIKEVVGFKAMFDRKLHMPMTQISKFLKEWFIDHVSVTDRKLAEAIKNYTA